MAKSIVNNFTDTPVSGATTIQLTVPALNYAADFRVQKDEPDEAILTNITSPLDMPERLRFAHNNVLDVYRNTGIDPTLYYASRRGTKILVQLTDVLRVVDSADALYEALLPVTCHLVLTVPNNDLMSDTIVQQEITRMLGGLYQATSESSGFRVQSLLRGALIPSSL